ncbi:hypothetical protein ABC766_01005 [Methylobacterium fujisawaense]|uniref:hypothetical protein n=1 Tax=Methylobacterium fujisawaense TaxID=107400 RepID=UPI0031F4F89D
MPACDARSLRASLYARGPAMEAGALWRARRLRNRVARTAIRLADAPGPRRPWRSAWGCRSVWRALTRRRQRQRSSVQAST